MVCWWLSWSPCLLAASPGLLVAHSPLGSHGLIVSRSHGLLVALMVSLSSRRFSWSLGCPFPPGFSCSHRLALSWSPCLLAASPGLLVAHSPWVLMVSSSRGLMVCWWLSWSPCLLAASRGLLVAHSPLGSHVSSSRGL